MVSVIFGENSFEINTILDAYIAKFDEVKHYDSFDDVDVVIKDSQQIDLFASKTLYVFHGLLPKLEEHLDDLITSPYDFIFIENKDTLGKKILKRLDELSIRYKQCSNLSKGECVQWIMKQSSDKGLSLSKDIAWKMLEFHGVNQELLDSEIEKLSLFTSSENNSEITTDELTLIMDVSLESQLFPLLDLIGERTETMRTIKPHMLFPESVDSWYVYHMIIRHVRQLLKSKSRQKIQGPPFVQQKIKSQSDKWGKQELINTLDHFSNIEYEVKSGKAKLDTALLHWVYKIVPRN